MYFYTCQQKLSVVTSVAIAVPSIYTVVSPYRKSNGLFRSKSKPALLVVLSASVRISAAAEESSVAPKLVGIKNRTMARILMVCPNVNVASSRGASRLFLRQAHPPKSFVSAVLLNISTTTGCTELHAHRNCTGEVYAHGRSSGFGFVPVYGRRFSTRATDVNDAGSIDSPLRESMEKKVHNISTVL